MKLKDKAAIFAIALILSVITGAIATSIPKPKNLYPETAIVVNTNESQNLLTLMTATGHVFTYETPIEDWLPGDICSMIMNSRGTKDVRDDEIRKIRYSPALPRRLIRPYSRKPRYSLPIPDGPIRPPGRRNRPRRKTRSSPPLRHRTTAGIMNRQSRKPRCSP